MGKKVAFFKTRCRSTLAWPEHNTGTLQCQNDAMHSGLHEHRTESGTYLWNDDAETGRY